MSVWHRARSLFPVTERAVHLDHAGRAPVSSRVEEAVRHFLDAAARSGGADLDAQLARAREHVRGQVAKLLAAESDEVAFVPHAAHGLERIADDVDWRRGDAIVWAGAAPDPPGWRRLDERGVATLRVPAERGAVCLERVEAALRHPRARLLVVAAVDPATGARAPLPALGRLCREHGVLLCAEASHQLGALALRVDACDVDYLVSDAHRFLLALGGAGILYRRRGRGAGPASAAFESGPANDAGITALGAAVDLLLELDVDAVERRVLELSARLAEGLRARGIPASSITPDDACRSGLTVFRIDSEPGDRTARRLQARHLIVAGDAAGVRVSPHCYIEPSEIDALVNAL